MVQEALGLTKRIREEAPQFRLGAQLLEDRIRFLDQFDLLPESLSAQVSISEAECRLQQAATEFKSSSHNPELITKIFQTIWQARSEIIGMNFEVPPCPYTREKLAEFKRKGIRVGYLPPELATQQNRYILGEIFPQMRSNSLQKDNLVVNDEDQSGWFNYEASIDAPYPNTTEKLLSNKVTRKGKRLLTLNQYIVATQDSKLFTGQFLDEGLTWARLGSRFHGRVVDVGTRKDGYLYVWSDLKPNHHSLHIGGRSSEDPCPTS